MKEVSEELIDFCDFSVVLRRNSPVHFERNVVGSCPLFSRVDTIHGYTNSHFAPRKFRRVDMKENLGMNIRCRQRRRRIRQRRQPREVSRDEVKALQMEFHNRNNTSSTNWWSPQSRRKLADRQTKIMPTKKKKAKNKRNNNNNNNSSRSSNHTANVNNRSRTIRSAAKCTSEATGYKVMEMETLLRLPVVELWRCDVVVITNTREKQALLKQQGETVAAVTVVE